MRKIALLIPLAGVLAIGPAMAAETMGGVVDYANPATGIVSVGGQTFQVTYPQLLRGVYGGEHVIITKNDNGTVGFQEDSSYSDGGGQTGQ
ncbi:MULTISPECIES: hypothetical protein [Kaistia]|uniref:DUF1344 domain-containing protein n=1 Tax=Kaistia nematophila TaxID=2994654 RepID=A0A9X3IJG5_9HYPH|nr:hypothetical protein [Kaistia nematophila]MCX5567722.1 hypothetical protein [Kaistia nematophila]